MSENSLPTSSIPALLLAIVDTMVASNPGSLFELKYHYERYREQLYRSHVSDIDRLIEKKLGVDRNWEAEADALEGGGFYG